MPAPFKASLVTPEAIVLEASVVAAQIPAADGLLGILINRSPLLAKLTAGVLRLDPVNEKSQRFLVSSGYAQMKDNELTILTTEAIPAEQGQCADGRGGAGEAQCRAGDGSGVDGKADGDPEADHMRCAALWGEVGNWGGVGIKTEGSGLRGAGACWRVGWW